jgi:glycosyltransferase involved in cell wall biosynthesis
LIFTSALVFFFLLAISAQLIFYTLFIVAFFRHRERKTHNYHPVSVIICARNEETNLRRLIPELLSQDHPDFEIIVVNDRSEDNTKGLIEAEILKDSRVRLVNIEEVPVGINPKKYGLTEAIKSGRNEIILLTDADCWPISPKWISEMSGNFNDNTEIILGYSPYLRESGFLNLFIRYDTFFTGFQYLSLALLGHPYMGVGRNLAYKKSLFLEANGFDDVEGVTGGDDDLFVNRHSSKANTRVCLSNKSIVYSIPKKTWSSFFRQKTRHLAVGKYYKTAHRVILGIFMASFLVSWFIGLVLIFYHSLLYLIISALLVRLIVVQISIHLVSSRLGDKFNFWQVIFLDFLYAFYYLSTGLRAMITSNIKWTN